MLTYYDTKFYKKRKSNEDINDFDLDKNNAERLKKISAIQIESLKEFNSCSSFRNIQVRYINKNLLDFFDSDGKFLDLSNLGLNDANFINSVLPFLKKIHLFKAWICLKIFLQMNLLLLKLI